MQLLGLFNVQCFSKYLLQRSLLALYEFLNISIFQTALLEDEIVARRGFWRRQRQKEQELTIEEARLSNQLMLEMEKVETDRVEKALTDITDGSQALEEASKREIQRRSDSTEELNSILPIHVVNILTEGM